MNGTSWAQVEEAINDLDFPVTKDEIVTYAEQYGDWDVVRLFRALPIATYRNKAEVRASVRLDPAEGEGQTPSLKAEHARSHHSNKIAEHLREVDQS
jgi:Protein of unknown function (DUF2795)